MGNFLSVYIVFLMAKVVEYMTAEMYHLTGVLPKLVNMAKN